jgi:hypothetical protein
MSGCTQTPPDELVGSIHEAAHAVVARHFGLRVELVTMNFVRVKHPRYRSADCRHSRERLIVSAAGDCATTQFLDWSGTGQLDMANSLYRLYDLGADVPTARQLWAEARAEACNLVPTLAREIFTLAAQLRDEHKKGPAIGAKLHGIN